MVSVRISPPEPYQLEFRLVAATLYDAASRAVVCVGSAAAARGIGHLTFGIPGVTVNAIAGGVARCVVTESGHAVAAISGLRKTTLLGAAGIGGIGCGRDGGQIGPCIERIRFSPAFRGTSGISGVGLRRRDAIELIVAERLRAGGIQIVRNGENVACVAAIHGISVAVGDVDGVSAGGGGLDLVGLEAIVESFCDIESRKG